MSEQNVMYISSDKNDGYPCLLSLPEPVKFKFDEPYPEDMLRISSAENGGYPCHPSLPEPVKFKFDEPYPEKMMRVSADINDGYPHLLCLESRSNIYFKKSRLTEFWWRGKRVESIFFQGQKLWGGNISRDRPMLSRH